MSVFFQPRMKKALANRTSLRRRAPAPERRAKGRPFLLPDRRTVAAAPAPAEEPAKPLSPLPFNRFCKVGREFTYIQQAIDAMHIGGDGRFTHLCHDTLERSLGVRKALLTTSCTHALEMAALLLDIQRGDEVIVPSFSCASTANAFALRGARLVFADIRQDTLNINEAQLAALITRRTRAIVPVHYGGVGCAMEPIQKLAAYHGLAVVEDNAHGLYGVAKGKPLGRFGCLAALSFHETANFSCGEGGALLINDPAYIERAEALRKGSSCVPSDILAAVLYAQMEARDRIRKQRRAIWEFYAQHLGDWAEQNGVGIPSIPVDCVSSYHLFYLQLPRAEHRPGLIEHLKAAGITAVSDYYPLHLSEMGKKFGGEAGDCPVTEGVSDRLLRLPFYNDLSPADQHRIVERIRLFSL